MWGFSNCVPLMYILFGAIKDVTNSSLRKGTEETKGRRMRPPKGDRDAVFISVKRQANQN